MYTINERPTIEVELHMESEVYLKNIDVLISERYVDRIIVRAEERTERVKKYLEFLIMKYENKDFYLCDFQDMNFEYDNVINCVEFTINEIPKKLVCDVGMLHIDISSDFGDEQKSQLERLLSDESFACIVYFDCSRSLSGLDYQRWLNILTAITHKSKLYLSNIFISTQNIVKHPCNAYLCAGNSCHSGKSNCPRYLYVTKNGVYPYKCKDESLTLCNEIFSKDIINFGEYIDKKYFGTDKYYTFINVNKNIYYEYILVRQCDVLEWNFFMQKVLRDCNLREEK